MTHQFLQPPPDFTGFDFLEALSKLHSLTVEVNTTDWEPMPLQYPALVLSSTNLGSIFRHDFDYSHLFQFWSLYLMTGHTAVERWTQQAIFTGDILDLADTAGTSLVHASTAYPVFQTYYNELVFNRDLVEFFISDITREKWAFQSNLQTVDSNPLSFFYKEEAIFLVSTSPLFYTCQINRA